MLRPYLAMIVLFLSVSHAFCQGREEFNGPYASWANVKERFGARGDGKADDTKAIQMAIDSLTNRVTGYNLGKGKYAVIYLPAGTYCISSTLVLRGKIGISILGEDPGRTVIKWTGADKDTMFWANGSAYFKLSRFTWNANGRKDMEGVGVHWKDHWKDAKTQSFASLNIDLSDNYFIGGFKYGISGGLSNGANDSEITIRRCLFQGCTQAGIRIDGFNALDYWVWDCKFIGCYIGISCTNGNYHVYRSFFSHNTETDLFNRNPYYCSVRSCYSTGSNAFSADYGASSNPFKRIFQDNTVVNLAKYPIEYYHLGKLTLWDNRLGKVRDTSKHYWANTGSWAPGIYEIMSINNKFDIKNPYRNTQKPMTNFIVKDDYSAIIKDNPAPFIQAMDVTPPFVRRNVFELKDGATADEIQSVINQAAVLKGKRAIVHLGIGSYVLDHPLHIPAGSDLQLCGDGLIYATQLQRKNDPSFLREPMITVEGPTSVVIRDLQLGRVAEHDPVTAIGFKNVDQRTAQIHIEQLDSRADTSLFSNRLNYLYIEKDNSFFSNGTCIIGGDQMVRGAGTSGVYCFGAQFVNLDVRQNGIFMAKDCWWEGPINVPLNLSGSGTISIDGGMIATGKQDSTPTVKINNFKGKVSLMNMYLHGAILPGTGLNDLSLLVWNIHFIHKMNVLDFFGTGVPYKAAFLGLNAQCMDAKNKACAMIYSVTDKMSDKLDLPVFLDDMTTLTRKSKPVKYNNLPAGVSNIYISRVSIGTMGKGIALGL